MQEILRQLLTGKDNKTYDLARVTWLLGFIAVITLAGYEVMRSSVSLRELAAKDAKDSALAKLAKLGLTEDEVKALIG